MVGVGKIGLVVEPFFVEEGFADVEVVDAARKTNSSVSEVSIDYLYQEETYECSPMMTCMP